MPVKLNYTKGFVSRVCRERLEPFDELGLPPCERETLRFQDGLDLLDRLLLQVADLVVAIWERCVLRWDTPLISARAILCGEQRKILARGPLGVVGFVRGHGVLVL